jgi:hypothetical protein
MHLPTFPAPALARERQPDTPSGSPSVSAYLPERTDPGEHCATHIIGLHVFHGLLVQLLQLVVHRVERRRSLSPCLLLMDPRNSELVPCAFDEIPSLTG